MPIRSLALLARLLAATSGDVWNATYLRGDGQPEVSTRFGARLSSRKVIDLDPNITTLARFAQTIYPNQNTWHLRGEGVDEEVFLAHVVYKNDAGSSLDDTSYLQAWTVEEGDGPWRRILKRSLSCPSVVITIPDRGPYVYEARPDVSPGDGQFHRECSCTAQRVENCLRAPQFLYIGTNVSAPPQESLHLTSASGLLPASMYSLQDGLTAPLGVELLRGEDSHVREVVLFDHSWLEFSPTTWSQDQMDATRNSICCDSRDAYLGNGPRISDLASAACRIAPVDSASPNSTRVFNKWVVVTDSFCDVTAQYKSLLLSNAHGMILLTNGTSSPATDYQVYAYSTEVSLMTMPLLVVNSTSTIAIELVENLKSGKTVQLTDEAILGITSGLDTVYSIQAGLRVYDTGKSSDQSDSAAHYKDVFNADPGGGLVMWMEHSEIRPLLFVCIRDEGDSQKPEGRIHIYDTTNPMVDIRLIYTVTGDLKCRKNDFHDVHIIDKRVTEAQCPGINARQMYVTTVLDPNDKNRIYYYDTTDIRSWRMLREVHADWEYASDGLGNVRYTVDGAWHAVTWHCDTRWCGDNYGEKLYWLPSYCPSQLSSSSPTSPFVTNIPISRGSFAKDIACSMSGICAVSMTFDGVTLVDSNNNSNQFGLLAAIKQESSYLDELRSFYTFQANPWLRLFAGAQRILASKKYRDTWFYEFSTMDGQILFNSPERDTVVVRSLRKDRIYSFTLSGYEPPSASEDLDPEQKWRFDLKCGSAFPSPTDSKQPAECPLTLQATQKHQRAITAVNPSFIPGWPYHCCSPHYSLCGSGPLFCDCRGCIDYQEVYGMKIPAEQIHVIAVETRRYIPAWPYWLIVILTTVVVCASVHRCISKRMEQRRSNARADAGSPDNSYLQGMNLAYVVGNPVEDENALATLGISRSTPVNRLSVDETHTAQAELPGSSESAGSDQARPTSPHVVSGTVSQSASTSKG